MSFATMTDKRYTSNNIKLTDSDYPKISLLKRVHSPLRRAEVLAVLGSPRAVHNSRIWATGFLKHCGYSESDILAIISYHNRWLNFSYSETKKQIHSVYSSSRKGAAGLPSQRSAAPVETSSNALSSQNSSMVTCRYVKDTCQDCSHARIHALNEFCGCCPVQCVRCLPVGFHGASELVRS